MTLATNLIAIALYLCASAYLVGMLLCNRVINTSWLSLLVALSLLFHGIGVSGNLVGDGGYQLGIFSALSLIFWVINTIVLISSIKKPLQNLFVLLLPLAAIATCIDQFTHNSMAAQQYPAAVFAHIMLSLVAYSLLTIATFQALMLSFQNYRLKHQHATGLVRRLPPLQTMEQLLFEMLWAGFALLSLSIVTGFLFIEDISAQHLTHKTVFSLLAWCIYAILLWGRYRLGWRGSTAFRWTLGGFVALMLAYFGTKLVLELILNIR